MAGRLEGKRIIITGAVNNIGKEAVRLFVDEGARVVIGDRDDAGAATAAEFGAAVHFIKVDVTDEASVKGLVEGGAEWLGGLDPASPTPTPMRASSSCVKFWARPQSAVIPLHRARATAMMFRRFDRSARAATGTPSAA